MEKKPVSRKKIHEMLKENGITIPLITHCIGWGLFLFAVHCWKLWKTHGIRYKMNAAATAYFWGCLKKKKRNWSRGPNTFCACLASLTTETFPYIQHIIWGGWGQHMPAKKFSAEHACHTFGFLWKQGECFIKQEVQSKSKYMEPKGILINGEVFKEHKESNPIKWRR